MALQLRLIAKSDSQSPVPVGHVYEIEQYGNQPARLRDLTEIGGYMTSAVKNVEKVGNDKLFMQTQNTLYVFEEAAE